MLFPTVHRSGHTQATELSGRASTLRSPAALYRRYHMRVILQDSPEPFQADPNHKLTKREKRHRLGMKLEKWFGLDLSKKHFRLR